MSRFVLVSVLALASLGASAALSAQSVPAATSSTRAAAQPSSVRPDQRSCIRSTGSLIPAKKGECLPVSGRSYNQQDIQRTGETDVGSALQKLDPSITTRGH